MTVLVGIQGPDWVVLAADSQITDGDQRVISIQTPKIVEVDDYLLGVTGESRPGDILTYQWKPPKYRGEHPIDFMGAKVIPSMYQVFKENGYELPLNDKDTTFQYLLAFNGFLFSVGDDLSFNCSERGIFTAGSGGNYALGYLYSLRPKLLRTSILATAAAERACEIATVLDINCCPPIQSAVQLRKVK